MRNTRKTAALAVLLGSFALTGIGVAQAEDEPAAPKCTENDKGYVCVQHMERTFTTKDEKVVVKSTSTCSVGDKGTVTTEGKDASKKRGTEVRQKITMKCSSSISR